MLQKEVCTNTATGTVTKLLQVRDEIINLLSEDLNFEN